MEASDIAQLHALNGQPDQAFEWLHRMVDDYQRQVAASAVQSPFLSSLHEDSRWLPLLERIGTAPHQLAKINFNPDR